MEKTKTLIIRITEEQERILVDKVHTSGFSRKSDYVRSLLFRQPGIEEKINKIYEKVCENG